MPRLKTGQVAPEMSGLCRRFPVDFARKETFDCVRLMGVRLAQLRLKKGISQQSLARRLHISPQSVSSWESGRRSGSIKADVLIVLARFYGLTLSELVDLSLPEGEQPKHQDPRDPIERRRGGSRVEPPSTHEFCGPGSPAACAECKAIWEEAEREAV